MRKSLSQSGKEAATPPADQSSKSGFDLQPDRAATNHLPRWVKVFGIIFIMLVVLFVILHLTGNGFGNHMQMSSLEHWMQEL